MPGLTEQPDLERALLQELEKLVAEFHDRLDDVIVREQFDRAVEAMADARVKQFVPTLVYRMTRDRLRAGSD